MNTTPGTVLEVEIRGPLTQEEASALLERMDKEGNRVKERDRFLINFTDGGMRAKGLDLRVRLTNGQAEIVAKTGGFLGESRVERILTLGKGEFQTAIEVLSALGITRGIACRRIIRDYQLNDLVLSVVEVPGHSWFYEAELTCVKGQENACKVNIHKRLRALGLRVYTETEFLAYVKNLDEHANVLFDATIEKPESLDLFPRGNHDRTLCK